MRNIIPHVVYLVQFFYELLAEESWFRCFSRGGRGISHSVKGNGRYDRRCGNVLILGGLELYADACAEW